MGGARAARLEGRRRLLASLGAARLILLEAPGGYGKTTLAAQVVAGWELPAVRARFAEPTGLAAAVVDLQRSARRGGLADVVAAIDVGGDVEPAEALDRLVGALAARAEGMALVLDDVQRLDPAAATELAEALLDLPDRCRVVVAGRDLGPFAAWQDRSGVARLATDDLRFDAAEVAAVLGDDVLAAASASSSASGTGIGVVGDVLDATGGWCAAVVLAGARLAVDPGWSPSGTGGARTLLTDLVADVLADAPDLALLAEVPLVDRQVCEELGGPALEVAARASGWLPAASRGWSSLPDPIAEVLGRSPRPLEPDVLARIADHYRRRGELAAAVALLRRAEHPDLLVDLLDRLHWSELEELGLRTLRPVLEALADDGPLGRRPAVLVAAAQGVERADAGLRTALLDRAERLAAATGDERVRRAAAVERARDVVAPDDVDAVPALVGAVLAATGPGEALTRARGLTALGRVEVFTCSPAGLASGSEHYAEAAELFRAADETRWAAETLAKRGYTALYLAGDVAAGAEEIRRAVALLPAGDVTRGFWLTYYADVLDVVGRTTEAEAAATEAWEIGERRRDRSLVGMAAWTRSWLAARRRDHDGCRVAVEVADRELGGWGRAGQVVEFLGSSAECFARMGDEAGSDRYRARARAAAVEVGYDAPVELADARHEAVFGDPRAAIARLDRLDVDAAGVVPSSRPFRLVQLALAHARLGDLPLAATLLADARSTAAGMGVPDLLERTEAEALDRLRVLLPPEPGVGSGDGAAPGEGTAEEAEARPAPVQLRLLGQFAATSAVGDRTPHPGHPSTLVKLLAVGGPLTVDGAIDALWPDADLTTGRSRLRNLLNRIKGRAGEVVVRQAETLRLAPSVEVDIDVFERQASAALAAPEEERVGLARHALALYAGELLPGDLYEDWAAGPRERLKRRYLGLLDLVADDAIDRGDADEAMRLLDLGIAAEPLDEVRYRLLCSVLVARDRVGSAREVAARAVTALAEIGIEPADDLRDLAAGRAATT